MAKNKKKSADISEEPKNNDAEIVSNEPKTLMEKKRAMLNTQSFETVEMIKEAGGMKVGFQKKLPTRLAKQMVELGNAKII